MLDFYLGTDGLDSNSEKRLGGLEIQAFDWLQKNGLLEKGATSHSPNPPEYLSFFDDVVLSYEHVTAIYKKFSTRATILNQTLGFDAPPIHLLNHFLYTAIQNKTGLSTITD